MPTFTPHRLKSADASSARNKCYTCALAVHPLNHDNTHLHTTFPLHIYTFTHCVNKQSGANAPSGSPQPHSNPPKMTRGTHLTQPLSSPLPYIVRDKRPRGTLGTRGKPPRFPVPPFAPSCVRGTEPNHIPHTGRSSPYVCLPCPRGHCMCSPPVCYDVGSAVSYTASAFTCMGVYADVFIGYSVSAHG